jgi:hypothetical protein
MVVLVTVLLEEHLVLKEQAAEGDQQFLEEEEKQAQLELLVGLVVVMVLVEAEEQTIKTLDLLTEDLEKLELLLWRNTHEACSCRTRRTSRTS